MYYQWKVVKQWCPLCLTVLAVVVAQLIWSMINFRQLISSDFSIPPSTSLPIICCLLLPITAWFVLKPLILKAKEEPVCKAAYKRLLYNLETFNHLLQQPSATPDGYQNTGIEIGNPAAEHTIIKACNPYCGPVR